MLKRLTVALVVFMAPMVLFAAGQGEGTTMGADEIEVSAPGEFPIVEQTVPLSIMVGSHPNVGDYNDNRRTEYLEERTNVDVTFQVVPGGEYRQKINVMFASQANMPDVIFNLGMDITALTQWGQEGVLMPLNDLIDQHGHELKRLFAKHPGLEPYATSPDGNIYSFPSFGMSAHGDVGVKGWINQEWLDKLGLSMPTTTQELTETLRAFRSGDANENGRQDELMMGSYRGWNNQLEPYLLNSFVLWDNHKNEGYFLDDGIVKAAFAQSEYRDALRWLNQLVEEGLLSPLSFTQDRPQYFQALQTIPPFVGVFAGFSQYGLHEDLSDTYVYMMPLEGPGGVQFADYKPFRRYGLSRAGITSAARYPAVAYKFLDQMYELELTLWNRYGVPGEDWRYPDEGELDDMGRPAGITMLRDVWGTEGEVVHWHSAGPQWMPDGFNGYEHNAIPEEVAEREASGWQPGENSMHASSIDYTAYAPPADMYVPPLAIALESIETYNEIKSSLDTFVEESRTRFIVGDMDIETEWDTYLSGLENIGLDRLLEIMQEAYAEAY